MSPAPSGLSGSGYLHERVTQDGHDGHPDLRSKKWRWKVKVPADLAHLPKYINAAGLPTTSPATQLPGGVLQGLTGTFSKRSMTCDLGGGYADVSAFVRAFKADGQA